MGVRKIHNIRLVKIQHEERLAATSELNIDREVSSEEPDEGKPHVRFCEGGHSNLGAITPVGGAL